MRPIESQTELAQSTREPHAPCLRVMPAWAFTPPASLPAPPPLPPDSLGGRGATLVARRMAPLRGKRGGVEVRVARLRFKAEGGESMCINPPPFHPTRVARYEKLNMAAAIKTPISWTSVASWRRHTRLATK